MTAVKMSFPTREKSKIPHKAHMDLEKNIGGCGLGTRKRVEIKSSFLRYPQRIAVTRLLYLIQAPDAYKSSTSDSPPLPLIMIRAQDFSRFRVGPSTPNATHSDERLCLSQPYEVTATVCLAWVLA